MLRILVAPELDMSRIPQYAPSLFSIAGTVLSSMTISSHKFQFLTYQRSDGDPVIVMVVVSP